MEILLVGIEAPYFFHHMKLDTFVNRLSGFDEELDYIQFCGEMGDPCMHPQINDFVVKSFEYTDDVHILTNGGLRQPEWYEELANKYTNFRGKRTGVFFKIMAKLDGASLIFGFSIKDFGLPDVIIELIDKQKLDLEDENFSEVNALIYLAASLSELDHEDLSEDKIEECFDASLTKRFSLAELGVNLEMVQDLHEETKAFVNL